MLHKPFKPMLLTTSSSPPDGLKYIHQLKFDGFRCELSYIQDRGAKLFTRHLNECTNQFPEMQLPLPCSNIVLDGEMIVLVNGKLCWESVMTRFNSTRQMTIQRLQKSIPAHFVAFDILYLNGQDLRYMPLVQRLKMLESIVLDNEYISTCKWFDDGAGLFEATKQMDIEGIVSKDKNSKYTLNHRSPAWIKTKNYKYETVQISGIRKGEFGWLILKDGKYKGVMEFAPPAARQEFKKVSSQLIIGEDKDFIRIDPLISCKVKFQSYTKSGLMRSPSFVEFVS